MKYILDTSFFFGEYDFEGDFFTTPEVVSEVRDIAAKMRLEVWFSRGLMVTESDAESLTAAKVAAEKSGDARVLSETDLSVVALSVFLQGTIVSDDFAVQNVCRHLKIPVKNLMQKKAKKRVWKKICSGCGREMGDVGDCVVCGSPAIKRGTEKNRK